MDSSRNIVWRRPHYTNVSFPICVDSVLNDGVLVSEQGVFGIYSGSGFNYTHRFICDADESPVLLSSNQVLSRMGVHQLPLFLNTWHAYLENKFDSSSNLYPKYNYSIYPFVYSFSTAAVITLFLTSILFTKHYITAFKPSFLMRSSCLVATAQMIAINIFSLVRLSQMAEEGSSSAATLLDQLLLSNGFNSVYLIAFVLLLLCQVDIIKRIYLRRKEKKAIVVIGTVLVIVTQTLWGISTFASDSDYLEPFLVGIQDAVHLESDVSLDADDSALAILPVFVYLLEITLSVIYAALICVYCFSKRRFAFHSHMLSLTIIMIIAINSPIAFFIADISDIWVNELSDMFNVVCYVITNVTTWEWLNRLKQMEKHDQKDNLLGRPFFADNYIKSSTSTILEDSTQERTVSDGDPNEFAYYNWKSENSKLKHMFSKYRAIIEKRLGNKVTPEVQPLNSPSANIYVYQPKKVVITDKSPSKDESIGGPSFFGRGTGNALTSRPPIGFHWMAGKSFIYHERNVKEHQVRTVQEDMSFCQSEESDGNIYSYNSDVGSDTGSRNDGSSIGTPADPECDP
ncbi:hypothetical protein FOA43_000864 [Brettanomyces nanus]|uniref:pH-response regulator protein palH/RIM21 n=1 Tax=Eeniella nana TaxID=13502 RepID=A0A875S0A6_EENNA|nr:uncharacterized protein FOA43_000864 [Brettanomyces nanus]QPG73552.1 hypothetical protein FOA43_000864 [Brettanomyces nanus]